MSSVLFKHLLAIGVGLIGGSICLAAKNRQLAQRITGYSRRVETAQEAFNLGLVDDSLLQPLDAQCLASVDAVVLSVPVQQYESVLRLFLPILPTNCLIFDAGSTKVDVQAVVQSLTNDFPNLQSRFVGAHPIAGGERQGPSAASVHLFENRTCVITAFDGVDAQRVDQVEQFWKALDSRVKRMNAQEHDTMFAAVSHLPHLLAFASVAALLDHPQGLSFMAEGGAGFRDFTRIAASSPEMWADIFQNNAEPLLAMLADFEQTLSQLKSAIQQGDRQTLEQVLTRASAYRKNWSQATAL